MTPEEWLARSDPFLPGAVVRESLLANARGEVSEMVPTPDRAFCRTPMSWHGADGHNWIAYYDLFPDGNEFIYLPTRPAR